MFYCPLAISVLKKFTIILLCLLSCAASYGQPFKLMRFEENYAAYADSNRSPYQQLKYIPLSKKRSIFLSFGGDARMEYVQFHHEGWGRLDIPENTFLLQRYDVHSDLHIGSRLRIFAQVRSAWESGRSNGPRPIDEDHLNIQNLFADIKILANPAHTLTARIGRQELDYGSGRLISVREGPNLRLYFTGGKLMYASKRFFADVFAMSEDTVKTGTLDNKSSKKLNLWGGYGKLIIPAAGNLDMYYLGINRGRAVFEEGIASERRHTLGTRLWKYGGGFIYNLEGAYQFGKFGQNKIQAWTASADLGYMFESLRGSPSISVRHDYISGDNRKGDGTLGTFNPLYPKGGYFGFSPQIGPVNLIDIHPYASINLLPKLLVQADVVFNWRFSLHDGVYRPSGGFNMAGFSSRKRYIGTAYLLSAVYNYNRFLSLNTGVQFFKTGPFIDDIVPDSKNGVFLNCRLSFKF